MLSHLFLGMSLIGAEWVLYLLLLLSILSVAVIFERGRFYCQSSKGLKEFRDQIRSSAEGGKWEDAIRHAQSRAQALQAHSRDLDSEMILALVSHGKAPSQALNELSRDSMIRAKLDWEKNLSILATIGSNAPFIGLFGTVLGIIKAFHDLSQQAGTGAQVVTAGISEALVATAVGLLVAIPATIAFNLFQRKVKFAIAQTEALKSFLISKLERI